MVYLQTYFIGNETFCNTYKKNNVHKCVLPHTLYTMLNAKHK